MKKSQTSVRSIISATLMIAGGFVAFIGSLFVYFSWHIAIRASQYRPEIFIVERAEYTKARRGFDYNAYGTVNGMPETLPLSDFAPSPRSDAELQRTFPKGRKLEILFDPEAPKDFVLTGTALRMLPASYDIPNAFRTALRRTIGLYGPFIIGLSMHLFARHREKRALKNEADIYAKKLEEKRRRRELLPPHRPFKKR